MSATDEQNGEQNKGGISTDANSAAVAGAAEIVKRKRGRPAGSTNSTPAKAGGSAGSNLDAAKQAELQAQFERLYDPVVWEGIVSAPADIALAVTGDDVFDLPEKEVKTLSVQASVTARCFMVADPKWLALTMLSISLLTIYGGRTMEYFAKKAEKEKAEKNIPLKS